MLIYLQQLNIYGFTRLTSGKDKHGYYHPLFLRNDRTLAKKIERHKLKGTGTRKPGEPDKEPNFYSMAPIPPPPKNSISAAAATNITSGIPGLIRSVALDHSDRSSMTATADDANNVLLAQLLAAQQQSRFPAAATIQDELAFLQAQQQPTAEAYHLAAARRVLALDSLGLSGIGAMGGLAAHHPLVASADASQLELLLAQARLKAYMGGGGIPPNSQSALLVPTLAPPPNMGPEAYSSLLQSANSRAAFIQNLLGMPSIGETETHQDALRRALLQSSLSGHRDL